MERKRGGSPTQPEGISKLHAGAYTLPDFSLLFLGYSLAVILTGLEEEEF